MPKSSSKKTFTLTVKKVVMSTRDIEVEASSLKEAKELMIEGDVAVRYPHWPAPENEDTFWFEIVEDEKENTRGNFISGEE